MSTRSLVNRQTGFLNLDAPGSGASACVLLVCSLSIIGMSASSKITAIAASHTLLPVLKDSGSRAYNFFVCYAFNKFTYGCYTLS